MEKPPDFHEFKENKRTHRRRTLEQIEKEMVGWDHDLVMSVYHRINGRIDEADTYSQAYFEAQDEYQEELIRVRAEAMHQEDLHNGIVDIERDRLMEEIRDHSLKPSLVGKGDKGHAVL